MIQETEDMINLVKSSKYKGDQTEIEICSDYIKDLKKNKLKKIKSIKTFKDHVTLYFGKGEPLRISKEAFVSSYLYVGKSLNSKDIKTLCIFSPNSYRIYFNKFKTAFVSLN